MASLSGTALLGLFGGGDSASSLLATLYGQGTSAGSGTQTDPLTALRLAEKNRTREVAAAAKQPETLRDTIAFTKAVAKATTAAQALDNPAVMKVLLTANGLADQLPYAALAKKVLLSDPADPKSLVSRLADSRWTAVTEAFQFATKGIATLKDPAVQATLTQGYAEVIWRKGLEAGTPGLADALDIRERAKDFTSAIQVLGDPVMRRVVTTALGIPQEIAFQELPAQEKAITQRLDLKRLQDKKFVDGLSQRYLMEKQRAASASTLSGIPGLFI
jgi:hypothetical protein